MVLSVLLRDKCGILPKGIYASTKYSQVMHRVMVVRMSSDMPIWRKTRMGPDGKPIGAHVDNPPFAENVKGHFSYGRDVSRDPSYPISAAVKRGDTMWRYLTGQLGHAYELYPLFFLFGVWAVCLISVVWVSFNRFEVWIDRTNKTPPWDWERCRDNYWKWQSQFIDLSGQMNQRNYTLEKIEDAMLEAARARGTR
ncbi:hypothetical protein DdX_04568 [Ditylenchus destructor]|uniref:Uncharacterized protein n=1 Tax=Ditylenchus destructor TaxID=166010 RepID=A0AAD4RAW5_9BILA|nr:hypothetical protein DdX_04568 [Ditylenchus destructor]